MRYVVGFVLVLALVTSPLGVSAQGGQEASAVELQVDEAGVEVVPSRLRTIDGYTLEEMQLRVKRAKIGLWSTAGATVLGGVIIGAWVGCERRDQTADDALLACPGALFSGVAIGFSGAVGMIVTGALLGARKRKLREFDEAQHGRPHRVRWDVAQSRVVF
ncbi:MAG: hypothetical protein AMJ63_01195 [Myxococcales bacterium SG8_38_1]|jgi:hypothetical protein|nr:MAG: hypothetical protein AMJ63_01195 [Myxococcales bacterium SG8_38_1]